MPSVVGCGYGDIPYCTQDECLSDVAVCCSTCDDYTADFNATSLVNGTSSATALSSANRAIATALADSSVVTSVADTTSEASVTDATTVTSVPDTTAVTPLADATYEASLTVTTNMTSASAFSEVTRTSMSEVIDMTSPESTVTPDIVLNDGGDTTSESCARISSSIHSLSMRLLIVYHILYFVRMVHITQTC